RAGRVFVRARTPAETLSNCHGARPEFPPGTLPLPLRLAGLGLAALLSRPQPGAATPHAPQLCCLCRRGARNPWRPVRAGCRVRTRLDRLHGIRRHGVSLPSWGMAQISRCIVFPVLAYACDHWAERLHIYAFLLALPAPTPFDWPPPD